MTWAHTTVIGFACALVAFCIHTGTCTTSLPLVIGFAGAIAAGAFGHAGQARERNLKGQAGAVPPQQGVEAGESTPVGRAAH